MRNVRPAWFETKVDSAPSKGCGPKGRAGQGSVVVSVRERGKSVRALEVECIGSRDSAKVLTKVTLGKQFRAIVDGATITLPAGTIIDLVTEQ